ncbi:MAG: L-arabinose isomerase [Opitutaceae bacterium]|jgi:L-arabinose isomerase|nr:L-arabinose isomerase [Opitutaceae bacterium]
MKNPATPEIWFLCGSQHLYGPGPLKQVAENAQKIAAALGASRRIQGARIVYKALLATPDDITRVMAEADADKHCAGLILWMHTFSPSKMWIRGLAGLKKPFLHLHTQYHRDLPWDTIDMDFMNLHQSAHGDREAGFIHTRLRLERKIVVGHWSEPRVHDRIDAWARAARAWHDWQGARILRLDDNMRQVAVTEGDKVGAEIRFGFSVNSHGIGDLVERIAAVPEKAVDALAAEYAAAYTLAPALRKNGARHTSLRDAARIELGLRALLDETGANAFTDTFEVLHGLAQLPGLPVQRLMADGYGFGAEGDWKTAALIRAMKVMALGLKGGTSFMEDYTYHLDPENPLVLGSHMLEICPTLAAPGKKPSLEIHPLGIGGKADPVRLVFDAPAGPALNASLIDLGNHFRLVVNEVTAIKPPRPLPRLPVARAVWKCRPDFRTALAAWLHAGGAHHTGYSYALKPEHLEDFAAIAGIELALIDRDTRLRDFKDRLRQNDLYYATAQGLRN